MQPESNKGYVLLIYVALVLTTMAVYWRAHDFEFVTLDDLAYAGQNKQVLNGLTWEGTIWAFTTEAQSNWDPLTWLSLKPHCQLFEAEAGASHITNVLFHIANTLLLFAVLMNDGQNLAQRIYGGVIWTLSLYVESAAWVSERKDVLSTFFWMLTMWACLDYTERPSFSSDIPIMLFVGLVL